MDDLALRVAARFDNDPSLALRVAARFERKASLFQEGKFLGRDCRLTWGRHDWKLEELPIKGKKKCKVATLRNPLGHAGDNLDAYIDANILQDAKLSASDSYETIKQKMLDAYDLAADQSIERIQKAKPENVKHYQWLRDLKWYENELHYLKITPEDTDPIEVEGKDFKMKVTWTTFSVYSPQSDFQQTQPFYMGLEQSSATDARKLYQTMKADPAALKSTSYEGLSAWFAKNKIKTKSNHSSWT